MLPPDSNSINRIMALLPNVNDPCNTTSVRPYKDDPSKLEIDNLH